MKRTSAARTIYAAIKDEIFQSEIAPGSVLVVDALARRFAVSRTPVREALLSLCNEGLLEAKHHVGFIVTAVDAEKIIQTYSLRALLERESTRLAALRISDGTLEELAAKIREPDKTHNRLFHTIIAEASGWGVLLEVLENLLDRSARGHALLSRKQAALHEKSLESTYGHQEIYDALAARDPDRAAHAMERHLTEARERVIRAISLI